MATAPATPPPTQATIDDLARFEGKAELIGGRIVPLMPTGRKPNRVAGRIFRALDDHAETTGLGEAYTDNMGFVVAALPSGRQSFSPDVSYYVGPFPQNPMRFVEGPPTLAVEVRSEHDYGASAERQMAEKRADYFAAGTLVVWDVDPEADLIHVYENDNPLNPVTYAPGQDAQAGSAMPGWRMAVDAVFGRV